MDHDENEQQGEAPLEQQIVHTFNLLLAQLEQLKWQTDDKSDARHLAIVNTEIEKAEAYYHYFYLD